MVEDRVTDGRRIGELLASEVSGLATGVLAEATLVDVDADAEPSSTGTAAYRIAVREEPVGAVVLYPDGVELTLEGASGAVGGSTGATTVADLEGRDDIRIRETGGAAVVTISSGAAVKPAVDVLRAVLRARSGAGDEG
jgi:hypothetical protein